MRRNSFENSPPRTPPRRVDVTNIQTPISPISPVREQPMLIDTYPSRDLRNVTYWIDLFISNLDEYNDFDTAINAIEYFTGYFIDNYIDQMKSIGYGSNDCTSSYLTAIDVFIRDLLSPEEQAIVNGNLLNVHNIKQGALNAIKNKYYVGGKKKGIKRKRKTSRKNKKNKKRRRTSRKR